MQAIWVVFSFSVFTWHEHCTHAPIYKGQDMPLDISKIRQEPVDPITEVAYMLYGEARGEGEEGMRDVASVVYNRAKARGSTVRDEAYRKKQFSAVNEGGPAPDFRYIARENPGDEAMRLKAQEIAVELATDKFKPTVDATHYYNPDAADPSWGRKMVGVQQRGRHKFGRIPGEYGTPRLQSRASYE